MLSPILALESLLDTAGELPVNVKVLFEGEEEIGSPHLGPVVEQNRERLACEFALSADGFQGGEDQPALLVGWKGMCALQVDVEGFQADLHSGVYGGTVQNPIHALARLLDSMRSAEGEILVEGFYEDVVDLTPGERSEIAAVPFDEGAYKEQLGVGELFGEPGYTTRERAWVRPTLEINGIWGGFQEEGVKTVIPKEAHAKITCRLVADQIPEKILRNLSSHIRRNTPPGVEVEVHPEEATAPPYVVPSDHPGNRAAHAVLEEIYGRPPHYTRAGGTLPVCGIFLDLLDVYTVTFAFGLDDENQHAPDEFFRLASFERGQNAYRMLLARLAQQEGLSA
jgi:acetylornithine deacetylase/succinyl-diaminopimelate desuccinylase-like protein